MGSCGDYNSIQIAENDLPEAIRRLKEFLQKDRGNDDKETFDGKVDVNLLPPFARGE